MPRETSCGAIVFHSLEKKPLFLLLHYSAGHWDFPKGNVEKGETPEQTALRELKEETGISQAQVTLIPNFKERITYFYKREGKTIFKEVFFFLLRSKTRSVKISKEHLGHKWLPYEEALEKLTYKNAKEVLEKANKFISR